MAAKQKHESEIDCAFVDKKGLQTTVAVGGPGGHEFQLIGENGIHLKSLILHMAHNRVSGIEATLTDGKKSSFGRTGMGNSILRFNFGPRELFLKVVLRGARASNYDSLLCGGAIIHLTGGRVLEAMASGGLQEAIEYPVGSGLCIGVFGRCGWEIDCLGFAMQEEVLEG